MDRYSTIQISWENYESITVLVTTSRLIVTDCPCQFFQYVLLLYKTNVLLRGGLQALVSYLNERGCNGG